ncbi:hypothetical protein ACLMJK_008854 [Lecanora helva]
MSLDLLQEFGAPKHCDGSPEIQGVAQGDLAQDDDEFGDFEAPENVKTRFQKPSELISPMGDELSAQQEGLSIEDGVALPPSQEMQTADDEDEWGDFNDGESVLFDADQAFDEQSSHCKSTQIAPKSSAGKHPTSVSLLPIDRPRAIIRPAKPMEKPLPAPYDYDQDEIWQPTDITQEALVPAGVSAINNFTSTGGSGNAKTFVAHSTTSGPPPANIPPPSTLIPFISQYFQLLPTEIKRLASTHDAVSDPSQASSPQQVDQIQAALAIIRAGARILAGRKLRWKRDSILSQSMKIGPAGGKINGMKLTGIDKSESRREDQEAAEALSMWRKQAGPLRSIMSTAKDRRLGTGVALPDISENMPIRVVKPGEGAVTAPKACFLCGIKRDERVAKIDNNVQDSFGEWWREHWGHVDCVRFWENHKSLLPQR